MPRSSTKSRRIALTYRADKVPLEKRGERAARRVGGRILRDVLAAWRTQGDPAAVVRRHFPAIVEVVETASLAAHLAGRFRGSRMDPIKRRRPITRLARTEYDAATNFMRRRLGLDSEAVAALRQTYSTNALLVATEFTGPVEAAFAATAAQAIADQVHVREGMDRLRETAESQGISPIKPFALERMFRNAVGIAYAAGRTSFNDDPAIQEILWGYEYVSMRDDRVRPAHFALDGTKLPKDDPRWESIAPPNGHNCRCERIEIFDSAEAVEPESVTVDGVLFEAGPDAGWDFDPGRVFADVLSAA